jgi:hypothetical protein
MRKVEAPQIYLQGMINHPWARYAENCIWLVVPMMLFNAVLMRRLPRAYQTDVFDHDIPRWIRIGENIGRTIVFALPLFMPLKIGTFSQKAGFALYLIGTVLYGVSWGVEIWYPRSPWCRSAWGFMAPAYTPLIWLVGIGLIGKPFFMPVGYSPWVFLALSAAFLAFHNSHAWIVYKRNC